MQQVLLPYANGRVCHDADAHVFECPDFYLRFADPDIRAKMPQSIIGGLYLAQFNEAQQARQGSDFVQSAEAELMQRKLWRAMGAYTKGERARALELLGFSSQLVFDSFMRSFLRDAEFGDDLDYLYGLARTHNRAMVDFCAADPRLLPVGYVPMADIDRSIAMAREAIEMGCAALQATADCPKHHSPSHIGFDPMWSMLAEAGVPLVFHLGAGRPISSSYNLNGMEMEPAFHGGDKKIQSLNYVATPHPVVETLTALIVDGVLHRHPKLRIGLFEFGGCWLPGWMRFLDSAMEAFSRSESRLKKLDLKLSDYVKRQVRCTIFPHEDLGWSIAQGGEEIFMFSSDYPHIEGGRNPIKRFEDSMAASSIGPAAQERFYRGNFEDFVGGNVFPAKADRQPRGGSKRATVASPAGQ